MKMQLCMFDEYGHNSIITSSTNLKTLVKQAKDEVKAINVDNALASSEKKRNWEAMYIELFDAKSGERIDDAVFSGKDNSGQFAVQPMGTSKDLIKLAQCDVKVRVYLGYLDGSDWYASDEKGKEINNMDHPALAGKIVYYIRRVD